MILQYETNRWHLDEAKKIEITKIIFDTITEIANFKVTEDSVSRWNVGTDLSDLGVGPYHIKDIIEALDIKKIALAITVGKWITGFTFNIQTIVFHLYVYLVLRLSMKCIYMAKTRTMKLMRKEKKSLRMTQSFKI